MSKQDNNDLLPKARTWLGALHSDEIRAESACMVDKEAGRNLIFTL